MSKLDAATVVITAVGVLAGECDANTVVSLHQLFEPDQRAIVPDLTGSWTAGGRDDAVWSIIPHDGTTYLVLIADSAVARLAADTAQWRRFLAYREESNDSIRAVLAPDSAVAARMARDSAIVAPWFRSDSTQYAFFAVAGRLDGALYVDVAPANAPAYSEALSRWLGVPVHWFWKVSLAGGHLRLWPLRDRWVLEQLRDHPHALRHERLYEIDSTAVLLTASPQELREFLRPHFAGDDVWDAPIWLDRWPPPTPARSRAAAAGTGRVPAGGVTRDLARAWGCRFERVLATSRTVDAALRAVRVPPKTADTTRQLETGRRDVRSSFHARLPEKTACDLLAVHGAPILVDSFFVAGHLAATTWWYHDPSHGPVAHSVQLKRVGDVWRWDRWQYYDAP